MRNVHLIGGVLFIVALAAMVSVAAAQSTDIVFLDEIPDRTPDAGSNDADLADTPDSGPDSGSRIEIIGISHDLPEVLVEVKPKNARREISDAITAHVTSCIARYGADQSNVDIGFLYLVRKGRAQATLTSVQNDEAMHLSRMHTDIFRIIGETRPVDIEAQRKVFLECVEVVTLPVRPVVTERLAFRIKRVAGAFAARDITWNKL